MAASLLQNCLDEKAGYVDDDCWSRARREKTACYEKVAESHRENKSQRENAPVAAMINATAASSPIAPGQVFKDCPDCPEMVVVPEGTFLMGNEFPLMDRKKPPRMVVISRSFAMGKTVVNQGQWRSIMGVNPRRFNNCGDSCPCGDDCPVGSASWEDTHEFIRRLNQKTGKQYRLPGEAEWEYALGLSDMRNVFDISNPVFEWVESNSPDNRNGAQADGGARQGKNAQRMIRGGLWLNSPELLHQAIREGAEPALRDNRLGIRLVRSLP